MTASDRKIAEFAGAPLVTLPTYGRMLMIERPDATLDALIAF